MDIGNVYDNKVAQSDAVYIKPEYRMKGIARQIIQYFTEWSKNNKVSYIELKEVDKIYPMGEIIKL